MSVESVKALYADAEAAILREVARRAALRPAGTPATTADMASMRRYASRQFSRQRAAVYREVRHTVTGKRQAELLQKLTAAEHTATTAAGQLLRTTAAGRQPEKLVGLVDRSGRRWSLGGYADVATTGAVQRVGLDRQLRQLRANGVELVKVKAAPGECPKCAPFDGRTMTLAELDKAIRAGLKHIRCRCTITRGVPS